MLFTHFGEGGSRSPKAILTLGWFFCPSEGFRNAGDQSELDVNVVFVHVCQSVAMFYYRYRCHLQERPGS